MQYGPVPDFPIRGKIVAITGGGSGIGLAFARLCHDQGARVLIGDLKLVAEAETFISAVPSGDVVFQHCDVSSWKSLHDLITASVENFGHVPDCYVPCAGVFEPPSSTFWDDNEAEDYKTISINVNHPVKLTRLAMRALAGAEKQGVVCLVASTAGIRGHYLASLYATSKHAVVGFAKSMGQADVEEGVKVVCVLPGMVQSPLWEDRNDDMVVRTNYLKRLEEALQPADTAELLLRVVQRREYDGGTCVLKTKSEERVVEEGFARSAGKYDPSPRPEADLGRIKSIMQSERDKKWS